MIRNWLIGVGAAQAIALAAHGAPSAAAAEKSRIGGNDGAKSGDLFSRFMKLHRRDANNITKTHADLKRPGRMRG